MRHEVKTDDRAVISITDDMSRTLKIVLKGSNADNIGITFCNEDESTDDWHIAPERLYDLLWNEFQNTEE